MRIFNVKVNGKVYNVEVEEAGSIASVPAPVTYTAPAPVPAAAPVYAAPASAAAPVAAIPASGSPVKSPMPGLVLKLLVEDGATVKKNQKILVLEAMKMENDILASADGVVSFAAKKGDSVETGAVLAVVR